MAGQIPEIYQARLPGGLNLVGVEYQRVPWVSLTFLVKRGAETDPLGKAGVADWTAELLTLGTARRSQLQLAQDVESLGAGLRARAAWDAATVTVEGLAEDFPQLMDTLAEVVQTPGFPEEEFLLLRERRRAELAQLLDDPREVATRRYYRLFFGSSPYGQPIMGEPETLNDLSLEDLQQHYRREFTPSAASLVVVGMVPGEQVEAVAARFWSGWPGGGPASMPYTQAPAELAAPGIYLLDRPELAQSEIRLGHLGLTRSHPDFFPLRLANYVLGEGGFSSRLMSRIRADLGLTYGIRSMFHFRRAPGPFAVSTFTPAPHTAQVVQEITAVMNSIQKEGPKAQELEEAQSYFVGHFPLGLETPRAINRQLVSMDMYDLGWDYLRRYRENIQSVTLAAARRAAQTHLHPQDLVTLVVGPAAQCRAGLETLGPVNLINET
jgi:zinc protease